ncbi:MAG TPA: mechanosensitive ion channel domain-containing protein [Terriglobales bacterium]|nr:mechanosensitive ion channel domain-containing protein [Terriglobales bacterium]
MASRPGSAQSSGATDASRSADAQGVISFLNQTIVWYRQLTTEQEIATEPSDVIFLNQNRQLADQVVRLSFDFARADAQLLSAKGNTSTELASSSPGPGRYQSLVAMVAKADQQVKAKQQELAGLRAQLDVASGRRRATLASTVAETQSELDLLQVRRDSLRSMIEFVSGRNVSGLNTGSLQAEIEDLARTIPAAATDSSKITAAQAAPVAAANPRKAEPSGILALLTELFGLRRRVRILDQGMAQTAALANTAKAMRAPLVRALRDLVKRGDALSNQPDSQDAAVLARQKQQLDDLTAQFKQLSGVALPLAKQSILLDLYSRSLANWRDSVHAQYISEVKGLALRLIVLAVILGFVFVLSSIWRKATFRYVQDVRRRYQFLLLRRIVVWSLIAVIVAVAFASELGTLATFAGLLTAGIAVALQNVILSVAGYFFLIGKYGVRVGDRVQIAGVTGEVVEIGLVRMHLMEIGSGSWGTPTGRMVVFSNSVVFQPTAGLFKQIPGTRFDWHQITLTVAAESDYHQVEERLTGAVNAVFEHYRERMERQRRSMEKSLGPLSANTLHPETRLRLAQGGLEVVIRYPVELDEANKIDDRIAREVLDAINRPPKLKLVGSGTPNIQAVQEGKPAGA